TVANGMMLFTPLLTENWLVPRLLEKTIWFSPEPIAALPAGATKLTVPGFVGGPTVAELRLSEPKVIVEPAKPLLLVIVELPPPSASVPSVSLERSDALPRKLNVPPFIVRLGLFGKRPVKPAPPAMLMPVLSRVSVAPWLTVTDVLPRTPLP